MKIIKTIKYINNALKKKNLIFIKKEHSYIYYKCEKHLCDGIFKVRSDHIDDMKGCPKCANKNKTTSDAKSNPNISKDVEILGEYTGWDKKVKCRCKLCNNIMYIDWNHLYRGQGCKKCHTSISNLKRTKSQKQFELELYDIQPNLQVIGKYINTYTGILCKCLRCGTIFKGIAHNLLIGDCGCPKCRSSIGEFLISEYLDNKHIVYDRQHTFDGCVDKQKLRFDFYLPEHNICIEFQGEQHYFPVRYNSHTTYDMALENFNNLQRRDEIKRNFCKNNNIQLIEISYKNRNSIKIREILDNII